MAHAELDFGAFLPEATEGWEITEEDRIYNRASLHNYLDGAAELYLSYGFDLLISRSYSKPGQPDIVVDCFDMGSSRDAFGVFSHAGQTGEADFGQGSQYTEGLLLFWKGRYFVSIMAHPETIESKSAVFSLAGKIEDAIAEEGPLPEILNLLPQGSLVRESVLYFRNHVWLNSYCFVSDQDILHIDEGTDALLAKYGDRSERQILLLVRYRNPEDARRACDDFERYYLPELSKTRVVQVEDGTWTACVRSTSLVIVVFNAPTEKGALALVEDVQKNLARAKPPEPGKAGRKR